MKRRAFIRNSAAGISGMALLPGLVRGCGPVHDPLHDFGLITNVVGEMIRADHRSTMTLLAEMGYKYLEFGGTYGEDPAVLKSFMESIGLIPVAGGTSINGLQGDDLKRRMDQCLEMGKKYLVCYWPWMDSAENLTRDAVAMAVENCQEIGMKCNEQELRFAWHNHHQEFGTIDGQVIYDYILENTEPGLVTMEVDLYWAYKGGADIREYFRKYPGRFELVHVKDSYESPDLLSFACVGSGILNFEDLFSYRKVAGFKHLIVEHDDPEDEEECARSSIEYLNTLEF